MTAVRSHRKPSQTATINYGPSPQPPGRTWVGWRHSLVLALDNPTLPTCAVCGCLLADAEHSPRCKA